MPQSSHLTTSLVTTQQVNPYMATPRRCRGYNSSCGEHLLYIQVACTLYKWQVVVLAFCFNSYQSQFTLHLHFKVVIICCNLHQCWIQSSNLHWWCFCQHLMQKKVPDNHPLDTPIMTSPLDLEPGCCFMQELKRLSYDCLQTAHLVIHVHFIVISCTLPCISLTWVHHMHCLGTPARISRHLPTLYI